MLFMDAQSTEQLIEGLARELDSAEVYYGHGTDNAWDEAYWLVRTLLRRDGQDAVENDLTPSPAMLEELSTLLELRIRNRKPLAYLLHEAWFAGLPFYVDERVLVPRSPMAELILSDFSHLLKTRPCKILDLCTGSGCIGIAAAMQYPESSVVLSDLSLAALEVAQINIRQHELDGRVEALQSDLFLSLHGRFDLILCNPPYVGEAEYHMLPAEYHQEPAQGLLSDDNGLAIPLQIIRQAADFLTEDGCLILEVGNSWELLEAALPGESLLWLEFENGGYGVCAFYARQLRRLADLPGN
jgi:ribosomal protein L3 glutamine methyltransferase